MTNVANPWGLSAVHARTMDAVIEHGSHKHAARALGLSPKTIANHMQVAGEMMFSGGSRIRHLILWDRWRRAAPAEVAE